MTLFCQMLSGVQRFSHQTQREVEEKKKRNDHFGLCTKPKHNVVMHEECEKITRDYLKTYIVYVCRYEVVSDQAEPYSTAANTAGALQMFTVKLHSLSFIN